MSEVLYQDSRSIKLIISLSGWSSLRFTIEEAIFFAYLCYRASDASFVSSTTVVVLAEQLFYQSAHFKVVLPLKRWLHQSGCSTKQILSLLGQKYKVIASTQTVTPLSIRFLL